MKRSTPKFRRKKPPQRRAHPLNKEADRQAARAYEALIRRAFQLLRADPARAGVRQIEELGSDFSLCHLRHARAHGAAPKQARHIIVFTHDHTTLTILRVLHDSMDIAERVGEESRES